MVNKELLVTGVPRSGTAFYREVLNKKNGMKMGHERMDEDGVVSGFFWGSHPWYPYGHNKEPKERRQDYVFNEIEVLVRNPLYAIPSLAHLLGTGPIPAALWYEEVLGVSRSEKPLRAAIEIWVRSHDNILGSEFISRVVRLEDVAKECDDIAIPNISFRRYYREPLRLDEVYTTHPEMLEPLKEWMVHFGYIGE